MTIDFKFHQKLEVWKIIDRAGGQTTDVRAILEQLEAAGYRIFKDAVVPDPLWFRPEDFDKLLEHV